MKVNVEDILKHWLPIAFISTLLCGLVYTCVQQTLRQGANDPQIQMVQDAITKTMAPVVPNGRETDLRTSLKTFMIKYDRLGRAVSGDGVLDSGLPTPPLGVFDYTKQHGEDRFTWEPEPGVRIAAVVAYFRKPSEDTIEEGYILAGRSLKEVEKRENQLFSMTVITWLISLTGSFFLLCILHVYCDSVPRRLRES